MLTFLSLLCLLSAWSGPGVLVVVRAQGSSLGEACTDEAATAFAECLRENACGTFADQAEKCDCYEALASCYDYSALLRSERHRGPDSL